MLINLKDEKATARVAQQLARVCTPPLVIYLIGSLGAGKTTLARYMIKALGYQGHVKSPTYTLVEHYQGKACSIYHFDLYRLSDPEELDFIGIRDYFTDNSVCFIEWPEKGKGFLPPADCCLELAGEGVTRTLTITPKTAKGQVLSCLFSKN